MDPSDLGRYLQSKGWRLHKRRPNGMEVWIKDDERDLIVFFAEGPVTPQELERVLQALKAPPGDLGNWRKANNIP